MTPPRYPEELLHDLDESQLQAVVSPARPLAILAPAGSGKTRVLTRRIAWRAVTEDAEPTHILAITFTRKAATELRSRLNSLGLPGGVAAGTFHGVAYTQLRTLWNDRRRTPPGLAASKTALAGDALDTAGTRGGGLTPASLAGEIEWAKARLVGPDDYVASVETEGRHPPAGPERVAAAYRAYEQVKKRRNLVDFDDLLKICGDALLTDPAFADAQHWRFRHLFVDEFQDVNPLQLRLLDAWRGDRHDLCVVGDPQQAIYGWNGADAGFLENFRERYPPADVIHLRHNYRSTPQILAAADHALRRARLTPVDARATQTGGAAPRVTRHPTDAEEAAGVARAVRDARAPRTSWSDQAVLVRTHGQIPLISEALRAAQVPHRVRGDKGLLDQPDVRQALDLLRRDRRPLTNALPDLDALLSEAERQDAPEPGDEPGDTAPPSGPSPLASFVDLARDHHRVDPYATAAGFAAWAMATLQSEGSDIRSDAVTVATFHAAKGLEWPVVHLAGLEDGFVPVRHARTATARAEEARLLYVAMTRALRWLSCTWAAQRTFNNRVVDRRLCPWLERLDEAGTATDGTEPQLSLGFKERETLNDRLAEQRATLAAARPPPAPALAAARAWRETAARAARVPEVSILDDRALEAVASAMPSSREELGEVSGLGPILLARVGDDLLAALHSTPD